MKTESWPMLRAMVGVGLVCGVLIVSVYQATKPVIARNRADALQAAIFEVLPGAKSSQAFRLVDGDTFEAVEGQAAPGDALVYAGYDASGNLAGFAIEGAGMGYQDTIRLLWGYDPAAQTVIGFHVLESKETPGLGDKITSDEAFLANFRALDVRLDSAGAKLANPVVAVKHGQKANDWQVDGITGATISSVAVSGILDQSAASWLPKIQKDLSVFKP
ncbi:MAG: FMN-binding protein [Bryobacterales bacterium]|nr:FMN-binding protein [Bryobacterales bacterium]